MENRFNFLNEDIFIVHNNTNYVHWVLCVILVMVLLVCWFSKKIVLEGMEMSNKFNGLTKYQKKINKKYAYDNPTIQYTVNPVIRLIDNLKGTKWYPQNNPRRVNSIIDPMTESKLVDLLYP